MSSPHVDTINIGIVGYGRMGHEIENVAKNRNHNVVFTIDPKAKDATSTHLSELGAEIKQASIVIDFSLPDAVLSNTEIYAQHGISAVVGTTGWEDKLQFIQPLVENNNIGFVHGGNFSIGAHLLIRISEYAASLFNKVPEYDVAIWESHHNKKKDRPSGTGLMIANRILSKLDRKKKVDIDIPHDAPIDPQILSLISMRVGHEMGFHECIADSAFDTIKISHHARARAGFALGAVMASEWTVKNNKKGFIHVDHFIDAWLKET